MNIPLLFRDVSARNPHGNLSVLTRPVPVPLLSISVVEKAPVYVTERFLNEIEESP